MSSVERARDRSACLFCAFPIRSSIPLDFVVPSRLPLCVLDPSSHQLKVPNHPHQGSTHHAGVAPHTPDPQRIHTVTRCRRALLPQQPLPGRHSSSDLSRPCPLPPALIGPRSEKFCAPSGLSNAEGEQQEKQVRHSPVYPLITLRTKERPRLAGSSSPPTSLGIRALESVLIRPCRVWFSPSLPSGSET